MPADPHARAWIDRVVSNPAVRSGYLSLAVHLAVLVLLALVAIDRRRPPPPRPLLLAMGPAAEVAGDDAARPLDIGADPAPQADDIETDAVEAVEQGPAATPLVMAAPELPVETPPEGAPDAGEPAPPGDGVEQLAAAVGAGAASPAASGGRARTVSVRPGIARPTVAAGAASAGEPWAARRAEARRLAARARGGTVASEAAVERGLEWLARHQAVDGSWQFDLAGCRCDGACRDPGTLSSSTASTAIALLPFLGAGHTHLDGRHQQTVSRGIYYLLSRMERTARGGDFSEGTMYGHGVTTLVLAEALGMTKDDALVRPVQEAVRFIETAQDMHSGGWRYLPGQAGDITVTAWQIAALKSARMSGLEAPSPTIEAARRFLDRVQTLDGAAYGYRSPAAKPCTSAIGLLCRMYTGWSPDHEALRRGVTALAKPGPPPGAIYHNFYLSQALLQMNHPVWPRWNARNRDQIVAQQMRVAHEAGSWFFADHDTAPGGRLAHTALAVLTLEVYYRLLPIYGEEAVQEGF